MSADGLTPRQRRFCAAILTARTIEEAAQAAGIARRTAHRYLAMPQVREAIGCLLDNTMAQAMRQAVAAMAGALDTLQEIHADEEQAGGVRVMAARAILENAARLKTEIDLTERVQALEVRYNGNRAED